MKREIVIGTGIGVIFGLAMGLYLGRSSFPALKSSVELQKAQNQNSDFQNFGAKLKALLEVDLIEYERLKSLEEKYKKADEVLGKILELLLTDLGIRINQKYPTGNPLDKNPQPAVQSMSSTNTIGTSMPSAAPAQPAAWLVAEKQKGQMLRDEDIADFLKSTRIDNLDEALKSSGSFGNRNQIHDFIQGLFQGSARVRKGDRSKDWSVEIFLESKMEDQGLKGKAQVKIAENGKVFSDSNDQGNIKSFREFTNGSESLLIRASPDTYFQLYYLKDRDALVGNIYERESEEMKYQLVGSLHLSRK